MAASYHYLSADQYSCPVCLEVLNEPVTIPCGHSYCMKCINDYWNMSDNEGTYKCPQCRRSFKDRPELNRSTVLTELIGKLKEVRADRGPSESYAGSDEVSCDVCTGRKRRAMKTCLTCVASYCETHLRPHLESDALRSHKLEEPTGNLEEKLCTKHQKVLEIFCRTDNTCLCLLCVATEHKSHDTVTPDEERPRRQNQLEERKRKIKKKIEEKEKKMKEIMETIERIQSTAAKEVQEHEQILKSVIQSIEKLRSQVAEVIRDYERTEVRKAEELMKQLEKEIKDLKMSNAELARLSQTSDHIHFLKKLPSVLAPLGDEGIPDFSINGDLLPKTLRTSLSDLKQRLQEIRGLELVKTSEAGADSLARIQQNQRTRSERLKSRASRYENSGLAQQTRREDLNSARQSIRREDSGPTQHQMRRQNLGLGEQIRRQNLGLAEQVRQEKLNSARRSVRPENFSLPEQMRRENLGPAEQVRQEELNSARRSVRPENFSLPEQMRRENLGPAEQMRRENLGPAEQVRQEELNSARRSIRRENLGPARQKIRQEDLALALWQMSPEDMDLANGDSLSLIKL
ncbi:E3 ubiquitin/ISG15 ligase TRIM25-like isoform X1 [Erpetoichthys calabaricus]|uniref:E3 ubiquitin/ISG15 ligase TRIM25-like isoform X1 n=1 Tax=Erpetoichthys calabaricus TaxID=27687 RepID=UPI0022345106|nr:E3 ubiquitin/ISG15 ligase TRIM25-like isoform X1 [Erpetoichthys calabaricus]